MSNRRKFIKQVAAAGMLASMPEVLLSSDFKSFSNSHNALKSKDDTFAIFNGSSPQKNVGAVIGRDCYGRPVLVVDGSPAAFIPGNYWSDRHDPEPTTVALDAFRKAGLTQVVLTANLGLFNSKYRIKPDYDGYMSEFWRGPNDYDKSLVDKVLSLPYKANPDSKFILWLFIGEYPEFGVINPDERIRNDKGESLIVSTHFLRFDSLPPREAKEHYAISFFSELFRQECKEMIAEFIKTVESSPYGKNVAGYLIGGGQDAQFYAWSPPDYSLQDTPDNWGDYSLPAKKAFTKWLEKKYGNIAALNKSWMSELISFEQVTPPPASDLAGEQPFHDLVKDRKAYDWKRFLAEGRAEFLGYFAEFIKKSASTNVMVGVSGGDGGHRRDNTSISQLLRSPYIDFFLHQASYGVRIPPSVGGINALLDSYTANGKLFLTDMDHRFWTGAKIGDWKEGVISISASAMGQASDMSMQRDMWRREFSRLWVSGNNGAWFSNMGPSAQYDNIEIQNELRFLNDFSNSLVKSRCDTSLSIQNPVNSSEVVFVFDEAAVDFARGALSEFHFAGMGNQWAEAHASGVPIRFYYAQDLRDGLILPAKLYVLQNLLHIDEIMAKQIRKLRKAGATVVVLQGTGMAQLRAGQESFLDETLGIKLRLPDMTTSASDKSGKSGSTSSHPLLSGDRWNPAVTSLGKDRLKEVEGITLTVEDSRASVLEYYPKSGKPAAAIVDEKGGSKVAFIGAYSLSREVISRLAANAGAWRVAPPGNVIAADSQIMMIHPLKDGIIEVVPKVPSALRQMPPGDIYSPKAEKHQLELKAGSTYLFDLIQ